MCLLELHKNFIGPKKLQIAAMQIFVIIHSPSRSQMVYWFIGLKKYPIKGNFDSGGGHRDFIVNDNISTTDAVLGFENCLWIILSLMMFLDKLQINNDV